MSRLRSTKRFPEINNVLIGLTGFLCFFPYLGVPAGNNSNVPLASICGLLWILSARNLSAGAPPAAVAFVSTPFLTTGLVWVASGVTPIVSFKAAVIFAFAFIPLLVAANAVRSGSRVALGRGICLGITLAAGLVIAQAIYIDLGTLPLPQMYSLPGYAPVAPLADVIVNYSHRPFGWFPEPSFMAGTMILGLLCLFSLRDTVRQRSLFPAACLAVTALLLSESGTLVAGLALLVAAILPHMKRSYRALALVLLPLAAWMGIQTLHARTSNGQFSWGDRWASIFGIIRYTYEHPVTLFTGLGKAYAADLYQAHLVDLSGLHFTYYPLGVYSIGVRWISENGLLFGAGSLVFLIISITFGFSQRFGRLSAVCMTALWLLVSTLTIGYDSASVVWLFAGLGMLELAKGQQLQCASSTSSTAAIPVAPKPLSRT